MGSVSFDSDPIVCLVVYSKSSLRIFMSGTKIDFETSNPITNKVSAKPIFRFLLSGAFLNNKNLKKLINIKN
jgi:hypothetical protein